MSAGALYFFWSFVVEAPVADLEFGGVMPRRPLRGRKRVFNLIYSHSVVKADWSIRRPGRGPGSGRIRQNGSPWIREAHVHWG